jgi:transposase InsO family protein
MVLPLTALTKTVGAPPFEWSPAAEQAFQDVKRAFSEGDVLHHPLVDPDWVVETDASGFAIGAILSQLVDGKLQPVAFFSRKLNPAECNYEIHDKELLAIVAAARHWRHYLEGSDKPVTVYSDHQPLTYFSTKRQLTPRQARWMLYLSPFRLEIRYRPGRQGQKPDALSRRSDYEPTEAEKEYNYQQLLAQDGDVLRLATTEVTTWDQTLLEEIKAAQKDDAWALSVRRRHNSANVRVNSGRLTIKDDIIYYQGRLYAPPGQSRLRVLQTCHDERLAGHPGQRKTIKLVQQHFWWTNMRDYVNEYVASCPLCQRNKPKRHSPYGHLRSLPIPQHPWEWVTMDFIEPLPNSEGHTAIFVCVDRKSKMAIFEPCRHDIKTPELAFLFIRRVLSQHGIPLSVVSDRGNKFTSGFWHDVMQCLGVQRRLSTADHPQTDGQTERVNALLEEYLRAYIAHLQDDWAKFLPLAEFAYNNSYQTSIKTTPFIYIYGRSPRFSFDLPPAFKDDDARTFVEERRDARELAEDALKEAQENQAKYYNRRHTEAPVFDVGSKVSLSMKTLRTDRPRKKLDVKYYGPLEILEVRRPEDGDPDAPPLVYKVKLPAKWKVWPWFHVNRLEPWVSSSDNLRPNVAPPPIEVEGQQHYEVAEVIDSGYRGVKYPRVVYRVRWKGYDEADDTYQEYETLEDTAREELELYHQRYPDKPNYLETIKHTPDLRPAIVKRNKQREKEARARERRARA